MDAIRAFDKPDVLAENAMSMSSSFIFRRRSFMAGRVNFDFIFGESIPMHAPSCGRFSSSGPAIYILNSGRSDSLPKVLRITMSRSCDGTMIFISGISIFGLTMIQRTLFRQLPAFFFLLYRYINVLRLPQFLLLWHVSRLWDILCRHFPEPLC